MNNQTQHFSYQSLETLRKNLLDLTGRNVLLNYTYPKAKHLALANLEPDSLVERLVEGKECELQFVPNPTNKALKEYGFVSIDPKTQEEIVHFPNAKEWAKKLGYQENFLEENDTKSDKLQSFCYEDDLANLAKKLFRETKLTMEESGSHILFLVLGFLEWSENKEKDSKKYNAPLYILPIKLESNKISLIDEIVTNVTLKEKLAQDFGLLLPEIENVLPNVYFSKVEQQIIHKKTEWKIIKKGSLVLLNFTKQAMYLDLAPENWQDTAQPLEQHPIIQKLFSQVGEEEKQGKQFFEEYDIDHINHIHQEFPLVLDADSSQHSALIDAVKGKNLVIEGPPGSGKSQTITNLIAACLNKGKKVLFVAEKMAALNVVKERLDNVGLGEFCLELHSHKTRKQEVLANLEQKLIKQYNATDMAFKLGRYEEFKTKLNQYTELVNQEWKQTGQSIHSILMTATNLKNDLNVSSKEIEIAPNKVFDKDEIKILLEKATMLEGAFVEISQQVSKQIGQHFWYGIGQKYFLGEEETNLFRALENWNQSLIRLLRCWKNEFSPILLCEENISTSDLECFKNNLSELPSLNGDEKFEWLFHLNDSQIREDLENCLNLYQSIHHKMDRLSRDFSEVVFNDEQSIDLIEQQVKQISDLGLFDTYTLSNIINITQELSLFLKDLAEIEPSLSAIKEALPSVLSREISLSQQGLVATYRLANLINQLPLALWAQRDELFDNEELDPLLEQLSQYFQEISPLAEHLAEVFYLERLPHLEELTQHIQQIEQAGLFSFLSSKYRTAKNILLTLSKVPVKNISSLKPHLSNLLKYQNNLTKANKLAQRKPLLKHYYQQQYTQLEDLKTLRNWYKAVREEYGRGLTERSKISKALFNINKQFIVDLQGELNFLINQQGLMQKVEKCEQFKSMFAQSTLFNHSNLAEGMSNFKHQIEQQIKELGRFVHNELLTLREIKQTNLVLTELHEERKCFDSLKPVLTLLNVDLSLDVNAFNAATLSSGINTLSLAKVVLDNPYLINAFIATKSPILLEENYHKLLTLNSLLESLFSACKLAENHFESAGKVNLKMWCGYQENMPLAALIERNIEALSYQQTLPIWLDYLDLKQEFIGKGFENIVSKLEEKQFVNRQIKEVISLGLYYQMSVEIFETKFRDWKSMKHNQFIEQFRQYDKEIMQLQQAQIAFNAAKHPIPNGTSVGLVSQLSELSLLKHEIGKKTKHIPIRELLARSKVAIQALKPCFMMSPMSIAQYLKAGEFEFDVVVMDEASQIRPEDAIGAIARGKSVVIVGDSKQLPPTDFFRKTLSNEEDENEKLNAINESESILDAIGASFTKRQLRWHYRSRHQSLIAFSNRHFYDDNLIVFPSPVEKSSALGMQYHKIEGTCVNRINVQESEAILQKAIELIREGKVSIGIVAMNAEQANFIQEQFDRMLKADLALQHLVDKQEAIHKIFIRNLENVQGDERDVILISMTYGPETVGGRVFQRFGPLIQDGGWRRLNVLLTRAKSAMYIYSSMNSSDVVSYENNRSKKALRDLLEYGEKGHLHHSVHTGKAPDSDFEIAVMRELAKAGYQCEPQLGVAGFFLDLAVRNPYKPTEFLLAIECDGATYHSAKSARDRDRLRQEILENLGWEIRRIWSTDWFSNSQRALAPILVRLQELSEQARLVAEKNVTKGSLGEQTAFKFEPELIDELDKEPKANVEVVTTESNENVEEGTNETVPATLSIDTEIIEEEQTLEQALYQLAKEIERQCSVVPTGYKRLLRPAMIELLSLEMPLNKEEFQRYIPESYRRATNPEEGRFLDEVFALIKSYC